MPSTWGLVCLLLVLQCRASLLRPARRPNLLLLMMDQHRADVLGAAGNAAARTPHLDALARDGLRMTRAYSSTPTCTPARAALLTGRSPWNHGMLGYGAVAPQYSMELGRVLRHAGYRTAAIGKNHFGWDARAHEGVAHGFGQLQLYDGLGSGLPRDNGTVGYDDYDQWFQTQRPGADPLATGMGWNDWRGMCMLGVVAWTEGCEMAYQSRQGGGLCVCDIVTGADPGRDPTPKGEGGGSTDPKIVARNNVLCRCRRRWRFCFRHTAGGNFFVPPYVSVLKILRISWRIQWLKSTKKDFDPDPASRSDLHQID